MLTCRALHVSRHGRVALNGVTAAFEAGQITALIGPNGAGKSTLLASLAGVVPSRGDVLLDGATLETLDRRARARRIAYLPQQPEVIWDLRVADVVMLGRMPHRSPFSAPGPADHDAVAAALQATDTRAFATRTIHRLSGGERARVMLARCLACSPDWLLVDEPLTHLDPKHQQQVLAVLRAEARTGRGVIVVLHDLTAAATLADQVLVLRDGQVIAQGLPHNVMTPACLGRAYDTDFDVTPAPRWSVTVRNPGAGDARA